MRAIGVDPSLTATGLAVLDGLEVVAWSTIRTAVGDDGKMEDTARRVFELGRAFAAFADPHLPAVVCVEAQMGAMFGGRASMATTFKIGLAYGAVLAATKTPPVIIAPSEVRRRLAGQKDVSKEDIRLACKRIVGTRHPPEPKTKAAREAVWDAVAVVLALRPELSRLEAIVGAKA